MNVNDGYWNSGSSESSRLAFLDNLRAVAIFMVVGVHTLGYCVELPPSTRQIVSFIVHTVSVPLFFLVDGFLLARSVVHSRNYDYVKYIRKSLFRLLGPWFLFTLTYTLARYAFEVTGFLKEKLILGHSWLEVVTSAYGSVYAPQLYFLFSLFLIRLGSPVFKKGLTIKNRLIQVGLLLGYYVVYELTMSSISQHLEIKGGQEPVLHALWGTQYYLVGIVAFVISQSFDVRKLFIPVLLCFLLGLFFESVSPFHGSRAVVQYSYLLSMFLFFWTFRQKVPMLNAVGENTMGIYLIHAPIAIRGVSLILNQLILEPIVSFLAVLFATFGVSLLIVVAIDKVPYGCLLFGRPYARKISVAEGG
jgi:surface polysaccharide O-acyltransferase-like enzyme